MAFPTAHYADSDADDEYERSVLASPHLNTDDDTSPTDSDPPSTEPTPTFGHNGSDKLSPMNLPMNLMLEWTAGQCADFISSLGLPQYCDKFIGASQPKPNQLRR
jgi:protein STE50